MISALSLSCLEATNFLSSFAAAFSLIGLLRSTSIVTNELEPTNGNRMVESDLIQTSQMASDSKYLIQ